MHTLTQTNIINKWVLKTPLTACLLTLPLLHWSPWILLCLGIFKKLHKLFGIFIGMVSKTIKKKTVLILQSHVNHVFVTTVCLSLRLTTLREPWLHNKKFKLFTISTEEFLSISEIWKGDNFLECRDRFLIFQYNSIFEVPVLNPNS